MAELVSGEEGIEKMRAPHVDGLYVGVRGSWAYRKQGAQRILIDGSLFCGWRSYPPPYAREGRGTVQGLEEKRAKVPWVLEEVSL